MKDTKSSKQEDVTSRNEAYAMRLDLQNMIASPFFNIRSFNKRLAESVEDVLNTSDEHERDMKRKEYLTELNVLSKYINEKIGEAKSEYIKVLYQEALSKISDVTSDKQVVDIAKKFVDVYEGCQQMNQAIENFNKVSEDWLNHNKIDLLAENINETQDI